MIVESKGRREGERRLFDEFGDFSCRGEVKTGDLNEVTGVLKIMKLDVVAWLRRGSEGDKKMVSN